MNIATVDGGYPSGFDTVVMQALPQQEQQAGNNSLVTVFDVGVDEVLKTTQGELSPDAAREVVAHLWAYYQDMLHEPIAMARIKTAATYQAFSSEGFRAYHVVERIDGPNLVQLQGDQLRLAVGELIWSICRMSALEGVPGRPFDPNVLRSGIDATARNFVIARNGQPLHPSAVVRGRNQMPLSRAGTPVLIDHWPAYKRYGDGLFHVGRDRDDAAFCERAYGTRSGAIATILYTGLYMAQPLRRGLPFDEAGFYQEWQDLVPQVLHAQVLNDLRLYARWYTRSIGRPAVGHAAHR